MVQWCFHFLFFFECIWTSSSIKLPSSPSSSPPPHLIVHTFHIIVYRVPYILTHSTIRLDRVNSPWYNLICFVCLIIIGIWIICISIRISSVRFIFNECTWNECEAMQCFDEHTFLSIFVPHDNTFNGYLSIGCVSGLSSETILNWFITIIKITIQRQCSLPLYPLTCELCARSSP